MARPSKWNALVRKSVAACTAAIEIYNKPTFPSRDDTFAVLIVCAWEGLLKARLAKEKRSLKAIHAFEKVRGKSGRLVKRLKLNQAGNPITISLDTAIDRCRSLRHAPLDIRCARNLRLLIEIRDNAIHYVNEDPELAQRVHEAGSASIRNFVNALKEWFEFDLGGQQFAILPFSFQPIGAASVFPLAKRSRQAANLIAFLDTNFEANPFESDEPYAVSLRIETNIVGGRNRDAIAIRPTADSRAPVIRMTDEDWHKNFPLDFATLVKRVRKRLPSFKQNTAFNTIISKLRQDPRLAYERRLDPKNPRTTVTWRYADAMIERLHSVMTDSNAAKLLENNHDSARII